VTRDAYPATGYRAVRCIVLAGSILIALLGSMGVVAAAGAGAFERSEEREPCAHYSAERRPFFGELHVHTVFSQDSLLLDVRATPEDAYRFARGGEIELPGPLSHTDAKRTRRLRRPLDFAAVTDHAEYFDAVGVCLDAEAVGHDSDSCRAARDGDRPWWIPWPVIARLRTMTSADWTSYLRVQPHQSPICQRPGVDCDTAAKGVWSRTRRAAEEAYDRSAQCGFTSFVAYEFSAAPGARNLHRNVIFRNERVPGRAFSAIDADNDPRRLWTWLRDSCLDAGTGCDALTIPHNSNSSVGAMFEDPADAEEATLRARMEPLVEIYQHKGSSECQFDPIRRIGAGTTDEFCGFERSMMSNLEGDFLPVEEIPARSFVRGVLREGLRLQQQLGVDPFRYGIIAATDNHNAAPGDTDERRWPGAFGAFDADLEEFPTNRIGRPYASFSPGGLAVVWAEENSRDALFSAMRRRETYATSGNRPRVRFFGGFRLEPDMCGREDFARAGYASGVPMGGMLEPPPRPGGGPRFAVWALRDPDPMAAPLQRIQIVKGWVDADGETHEAVTDVAGDTNSGARVDRGTLEPLGEGASQLCTVWKDPDFDPEAPAFYYARVLENPTPRWSTLQCRELGVDVFADQKTCRSQLRERLGFLAPWTNLCCPDAEGNPSVEPVIQERAWTSPIWYSPGGVAR